MSVQAFFPNQPHKTATEFANQSSKWSGRNVVITNRADQDKKVIVAGAGPDMFKGLDRALVTIAILFAAVVAGIAVGIATGSLLPALITIGIVGAGAVLTNLFYPRS